MAQVLAEITRHESVFTEAHLTKLLSRHIHNPAEVAKVLLQMKGLPQLMPIGVGEDGRERYTTRELFELENDLQELSEALNNKARHKLSGRLINQSIKKFNLKDDQARAIRHILKGNDITCLVGRAGTGKSYSLKAARFAWEKAGFQVHGVTLAGIAAENLEQDSGIRSRTIESLAYALAEQTLVLSDKDIIVMDEAGMTDALSMAKVMTAVSKANAKLVLVGDHAQLQPIGPGAIFRAIVERIGFAELTTIRRQKEAWQREATSHFAASSTEKALQYYEQHGHIHLLETSTMAMDALIHDWYQSIQSSDLKDNLILAYRNIDVDKLNQLAREKIKAQGKLTQEYSIQTHLGERLFAIGERVLFLENNWRYQVKNGQRGTIQHITINHQHEVTQIDVQLDNNKIVSFNPAQYNHLTHGYASTVHRAQGVTVKNAFVLASGFWNKNLSYVAMTRHELLAQLYGDKEHYSTIKQLKKSLSMGTLKDSVLDYPLAFAERRGIDIESPHALAALKRHLSEKLRWMRDSLKSNFEQTFFPQQYWENKAKQAAKAQEIEERLERRENAKMVAAYVDANRAVGVAFEALKLRQEILEITDETDIKIAMLALKDDPRLLTFKEALKARDTVAYQIYQEHGKYTKALAIYDISLEKLLKESQKHEIQQNVKAYLHEISQGRVIYRDKIAALIESNMKGYYPALLDASIDLTALKIYARQHRRRSLLRQLSATNRLSFKRVEEYQQLSQKAAQLWNQIKTSEVALKGSLLMPVDDLSVFEIERLQTLAKTGTPLSRKTLIKAQLLNQERDALAFSIYQDLEKHQAGLDFYQIGIHASTRIQTMSHNNAKTQEWARERFERLVKQASQHELKIQSRNLLEKYFKTFDESRYAMAANIIENKSNFYQAIFALATDPLSTLRAIHQDNKDYQRLQVLNGFSDEEKEAFLKVEAYVNAKRAVGEVWAESQRTPNFEHPVLKEVLNTHQVLRDALASGIVDSPSPYESALSFFHLNLEHLSKNAFYHQIRHDCAAFRKEAGNFKVRMQLARKIVANRSAYAVVKEEQGINWHQLQQYADFAIKQERISALSPIEQQDYQTALRYKNLRRTAGKLWSEIFSQKKKGLDVPEPLFEKAISINEARNALAFQMRDCRTRFDEFLFSGQVQAKDIPKHALMHEKHLIQEKQRQAFFNMTRQQATNPVLLKPQSTKMLYWDTDTILQALENRAALFVESLLGHPNQRLSNTTTYRYGKKGSLSITINGTKTGLWYNFESGEKGNLIGLIRHQYGYDFKQALQYAAEWTGIAPESNTFKQKPKVERQLALKDNQLNFEQLNFEQLNFEQLQKIEYARRIANDSIVITDTLAERYLREHRGITGSILDKNIRFNPAVWEPQTKTNCPALIVISRNQQDEVQAIQSIFLDPKTANKMDIDVKKRTYGTQQGAAVLVQDAKPIANSYQYALAEGPETGLSIAQANENLSVLVTLGISNFANTSLPASVKDILICADNDGVDAPSSKSLIKAIDSLVERGLNVYVAKPEDCKDFNDVLLKHGENEVKRLVDNKVLSKTALTLEQLIESRENLISDNAKIIVEFETKYREHEKLTSLETLEEVKRKSILFEEIGKLSEVISQDQGLLKETAKRHKVDLHVHKTKVAYQKHQLLQTEVNKIIQENGSINPIEEYLNIKVEKQNNPQNWANGSQAEKAEWKKINKKEEALAFIIDNTPELNYQAKQQSLAPQIRRDSYAFCKTA